ncbi:MAG: hypothetical protein C0605_10290 [Hyphomicrobiales bacterium]|nr:MAG: hypothetical protein C0605_10290 [Hyphomicrobiales bacterium]
MLAADPATSAEFEYCITAPPDKIVTFRERASEKSQEIGIGSDGNCGLWKMGECRNGWCKMQTHEFDGWVREQNLRRK